MSTALISSAAEPFTERAAFDSAVAEALTAAAAYYTTTTELMPDATFDLLVDRIAATKRRHPDWDDCGLLTQVAAGVAPGGDVPHGTPMLSLDKVTTPAEVAKFLDDLDGEEAVAEVKLDGMAIRVVYRAGVLVLAATRGDGHSGENITQQVWRDGGLAGLPLVIEGCAFDGQLRGEAFLTRTDFAEANINRTAAGKEPFANPRNAVAGALRKTSSTYRVPMSFAAYTAVGAELVAIGSHLERMAYLEQVGVRTAAALTIEALAPDGELNGLDLADKHAVIAAIGQRRADLPFPIDGVVLKADHRDTRRRLGSGTRAPKWAVAYKFPVSGVESVLRDIEVAVGRTGRASFRAVIEPVTVDGSEVEFATLHTAAWILEQGLGIGSRVIVTKANEVIPRVVAAAGPQPDGVVAWEPPSECPQCGTAWDTSSQLWRCTTMACSTVGRIDYVAGRDVWDIKGLGEEIAAALVDAELVTDIADLFDLDVDDIAGTTLGAGPDGRVIGTATGQRIADGITAAKKLPLNRHITALGILLIGRTVGRWLADHFGSFEALRAASVDELAALDGIGTEKARSIHAGLREMSPVIDRLIAAGITTRTETIDADQNAKPWAGKKVVITGAVPGLNRTEAEDAARHLGATVSSSVTKNTDLLVIGAGAHGSSKHRKAQQHGVTTMPADEFTALHQEVLTS